MNAISNLITKPGIYDVPAEVYHADRLLPEPSLSAGMINYLIEECPRICWHNSQRLNPNFEVSESTTFDIGTAAHLIYLEPHLFNEKTVIINADDYRGGDAKKQRDLARAEGKTPLLTKHAEQIFAMRDEFFDNDFVRDVFLKSGGKSEQSVFFKIPETNNRWGRCRPDWVPDHAEWMMDYKTDTTANPDGFGRKSFDMGYYRRAAWYLDGYALATGIQPEHYWFVVQSKKAPFLVTAIELDFHDLDAGREENRRAALIFDRCLTAGTDKKSWPGYRHPQSPERDTAFRVSMPGWAHQKVLERYDGSKATPGTAAARFQTRHLHQPLGDL